MRSRPVRVTRAAASVVLLALVAGCGGGSGGGSGAGSGGGGGETAGVPTVTSTQPPAKGGPLDDLPECSAPPAAADEGALEDATGDLVLPEGTVVTGVEDLGELVSVRGYVALTPIQVRKSYAAAAGLELYALEDEVYEAEVLYGAGDSRVFVKAQAQCRQGSLLSVFVGPEDGEGLPAVTGK